MACKSPPRSSSPRAGYRCSADLGRGPRGLIRFANPAAIRHSATTARKSCSAAAATRRSTTSTPTGRPYPAADCPMLLPRTTGESVSSDLDWFVRRDGSMFPVSYSSVPIELPEGRGAVVASPTSRTACGPSGALREHDAVLAGSRRRCGGSPGSSPAARPRRRFSPPSPGRWRRCWVCLGGDLARRTDGRDACSAPGAIDRIPSRWAPLAVRRRHIAAVLPQTWAAPRGSRTSGDRWPADRRRRPRPGLRSGAGAAIVVDGEVWGTMGAGWRRAIPCRWIEDQLADFTELVATAISNTRGAGRGARLADEQAALRRVATLVARESSAAEVFAAVAEELGRLLRRRRDAAGPL